MSQVEFQRTAVKQLGSNARIELGEWTSDNEDHWEAYGMGKEDAMNGIAARALAFFHFTDVRIVAYYDGYADGIDAGPMEEAHEAQQVDQPVFLQ